MRGSLNSVEAVNRRLAEVKAVADGPTLTNGYAVNVTTAVVANAWTAAGSVFNVGLGGATTPRLSVVDLESVEHSHVWSELLRLQHRLDAGTRPTELAEQLAPTIWLSNGVVTNVVRTSDALPVQTLPQVMTVLRSWTGGTTLNYDTVVADLHHVWSNAREDHRPAVAKFATVFLNALRHGAAIAHLAVLARARITPLLRSLVLALPRATRDSGAAVAEIAVNLARRGPPGADRRWLSRVGPLEVFATA